jgi:hypothetical protein
MADVNISKYRAQVVREGSRPASPGFVVSEGQNPVDPAGSGQNHLPVTIASASTGLAITDSQVLGGAGTTAQYIRGDGSLETFPSLTGFVPYTGATADVNLGTHDLAAERGTFANNGSSDTLTVNHTSGSGYGIIVTKGGNNEALYVSKTSGSGNAMTVVGGRTSLVDLALSSVTNTAGDFLTLSGGVVHKRTAAEVRTDIGAGTVTSVAALTLGTSGTDLSSSVANGTTTPVITLNVPTASATNRGALSAADWSTFNAKMPAITFNSPLFIASGGEVGITQASGSTNGFLSSTDWTTFNNKQNALTNPVTGTGTTNYLPKFTGSTTIGNSQIFDNGTNVGIGTASPEGKLTVEGTSAQPPTSGTTANSLLQLKGSLGNELNIGSNTVAGNYGAYIQASDNNLAVPYQLNLQPTGGNVIIGGYTDGGFKLDVAGTGRFSDTIQSSISASGSTAVSLDLRNSVNALSSNSSMYFSVGSGSLSSTNITGIIRGIVTQASSLKSDLVFFTNSGDSIIESMRLTSTGNVGIGTATPANLLQIIGNDPSQVSIEASSGNTNSQINLKPNGTGIAYIKNQANTAFAFGTNNTEQLRITSGGNLLVGTTTDAGFKLDVNGTGRFSDSLRASSLIAQSLGEDGSAGPVMRLTSTNSNANSRNWAIINTWDNFGDLTFRVSNAKDGNAVSAGATRMVILSSGNVGIGTSVPEELLELSSSNTTGGQLLMESTGSSTDNYSGMRFKVAGGSDGGYEKAGIFAIRGAGGFADLSLIFAINTISDATNVTSANERMRITSGGNVGIGTSSPSGKLSVEATGNHITMRAPGATAGKYWALDVTTANQLYIINNAGTQYLTITDGGNVGIGTSSPGQRLVVENSTDTFLQLRNSAAGQNFFIGALNGEARLNNDNSTPITMWVNGSERARITSGGNLLVGTTTDGSSKLRLVGLPTSSVGLSSGDVYNLSGVLMIA